MKWWRSTRFPNSTTCTWTWTGSSTSALTPTMTTFTSGQNLSTVSWASPRGPFHKRFFCGVLTPAVLRFTLGVKHGMTVWFSSIKENLTGGSVGGGQGFQQTKKTIDGWDEFAPHFLAGIFERGPPQFLAWHEWNSGYEIEICPRHQILAGWGVHASVKPFMKWTPGWAKYHYRQYWLQKKGMAVIPKIHLKLSFICVC